MRDFEGLRRFLRVPARRARDQAGDDVDAEIRFHLDARVAELVRGGLSESEARRRAEREFGDVGAARRTLRRLAGGRERGRRRGEALAGVRRDVAYGGRQLRSSPGFTAAAVLTLALGIGATTAIFSVVDAVLLRPLPYPEPDRLVKVWETSPDGSMTNVVSSGNYLSWRDEATSFRGLGAHSWLFGMTLTGVDDPIRLRVVRITPSAVSVLGVGVVAGRLFTEADADPGAEPVALISHRLWLDRFGGDPGVVGRSIVLDGEPHTVVGVMPGGFAFPAPDVDVWRSLRFGAEDRANRRSHQWNVVGRLADGVSLDRARAEMDGITARLTEDHPQYMIGWGANVVPLRDDLVGEVRALLLVLMGVVGVVLLLTCVNLANLLLARATSREREIAVRGALGAGRGRLVRQLLTESVLLGTLGGGIALLVIVFGLDALVALAPPDIPLMDDVRVDPLLLGFAAGTTLLATALFGLIPALRATAAAPGRALRGARGTGGTGGSGGTGHGRMRAGLLVAEVALAVVLVVGAGLLLRSMARLNAVDPGLDAERVMVVTVDIPVARYRTSDEQVGFYRALLERVRGMPGVVSVAGTTEPPLMGYAMTFSFAIEGRPADTPSGREDDERLMAVTPDFFRTLRIPILEGRGIEESDRADASPVIVVSQALARKQWPGGDAIGSRIRFHESQPWFEIVGVAGDARIDGLDRAAEPAIYIAHAQKPWTWLSWLALMVRTDPDLGTPTALAAPIRSELLRLDPSVLPERITTLEDLYAGSAARRRFAARLLGAFAGLALLLGALGIYGLLAYSVAQRRQEIGIRLALGAEPRRVAGGVVREALLIAAAGIAIGVAAALALTRVLRGLLFQVEPTDPATFAAACAGLLAVAAAAAWLPARSATRVDPARAIREA